MQRSKGEAFDLAYELMLIRDTLLLGYPVNRRICERSAMLLRNQSDLIKKMNKENKALKKKLEQVMAAP